MLIITVGESLAIEMQTARKMYKQKRDHFMKLSSIHRDQIGKWYRMDRTPVLRANGSVKSVYKHSTSKGEPSELHLNDRTDHNYSVPSLDAVHQRLQSMGNAPALAVAHSASFLREGLQIQKKQ